MHLHQRLVACAVAATMTLGAWSLSAAAQQPATPPTPQIIGGTPVQPGDWPWLVALVNPNADNVFQGQFCGGTLIDDGGIFTDTRWVLTAAHCVVDRGLVTLPEDLTILAGQQDLSVAQKSSLLPVRAVLPHPLYQIGSEEGNDIALIELANPVSGITPIKVATQAEATRFAPGTNAAIVGWGNRDARQIYSDFPTLAHQATLPINALDVCNAKYDGDITTNKLCAGVLPQGGIDTCQGDSGGPLMVQDGLGGWLHAGVVSYGTGCAWSDVPGVYARTAHFAGWINGIIAGTPQVEIIKQGPSLNNPQTLETMRPVLVGAPGAPLDYIVVVANTGLVPLTGLNVQDALPAGATLVAGSVSNNGIYNAGAGLISWSLPGIAPGESAVVTYKLSGNNTLSGGNYSVSASSAAGPASATGWLLPTVLINQPRLQLTVNAPEIGNAGQPFLAEFTVSNWGFGPAAGAPGYTLNAVIPAGFEIAAISNGGTRTGQLVSWNFSDLPAGTTRTVTVALRNDTIGAIGRITSFQLNRGEQIFVGAGASQTIIFRPAMWLPSVWTQSQTR